MNEDPELGVVVPRGSRAFVQGLPIRLVVNSLRQQANGQDQKEKCDEQEPVHDDLLNGNRKGKIDAQST
jgi:hypothetical protein